MRAFPKPKSTNSSTLSATFFNSGVTVLRTSATGAKPVITSDSGEVTDFCSPFSCHTVFIDSESLPTGMLMPKSWQLADTACTVR